MAEGKRRLRRKGTAGNSHQIAPRKITKAELQQKCFELKKRGMTLRAIGAEVGVSHNTVKVYIDAAIDELVIPAAESYRKLELERLDFLWAALQANVELGDEKAVGALVRVMDRRAKLLGLDAPQRLTADVVAAVPNPDILARIQEARARVANQESAMRGNNDAADG